MTESLNRIAIPTGVPTRSTDSLERSYGRTDGRTHEESWSPTSATYRFVTRTRAYGFEVWS